MEELVTHIINIENQRKNNKNMIGSDKQMEEENIYKFPKLELLKRNIKEEKSNHSEEKKKIEKFFKNYNIDIECKEVYSSINSITYIIDLKLKTRVKTIMSYKEDIMLNFNAVDVEFDNVVNEKPYLGIQIIYNKTEILNLGDIIASNEFKITSAKVPIIFGKDFNNNIVIEDLAELPHLLIAGSTGTGKSNFLSTFVIDIIYKLKPIENKLILIDTRRTNFPRFNVIPHLLIPVITESRKALGIITYLVQEMNNRYKLFENNGVDNIDSYNKVALKKLPRITVIIEDFCDLMMDSEREIERYIARLVQMSRAAGIHVIISTQRPSTDVITGIIKANIPARIAFKVPSQHDSRTIIDRAGAEELLIYGDVLYTKMGVYETKRVQTPYISDEEVEEIVNEVKFNNEQYYSSDLIEIINNYNENNQNYDIEYERRL